ncbi:MAG: adenosine kinase [Alphaproteobacteria bacterium]|nr:adenosine kinase [Alphaproteobacteria bacterium]
MMFDVLCLGNAIVDIVTHADDAALQKYDLQKGAMTLIDINRAEYLYKIMNESLEISGGSAANTAAGIASFGGKVGFIGKVHDDQLGKTFIQDIRAVGVYYETTPSIGGAPTARCHIFVTPDAQRTLQTYLGACVELSVADINEQWVQSSKITFVEGYLFDPPGARLAVKKAAKLASQSNNYFALSLSDSFCAERHRPEFKALIKDHVHILFANELEACSFLQTKSLDETLERAKTLCDIVILTRSEKGSLIIKQNDVIEINPAKVNRVLDTTGAGDLYAAGFLYAYAQNYDLKKCGHIASEAAGQILGHFGARPTKPLKNILQSFL